MSRENRLVNKSEYDDFIKSAIALTGSVTPIVIKNVLVVFLYASIISIVHYYYPNIYLPVGPFEYAGLILGLILVFRVNSGYDRWWEGRKIWGNIVNHSRNLAIIILNYTQNKAEQHKIVQQIAALPYLIKNHLDPDSSLDEIKALVDEKLLSQLAIKEHKPNYLSSVIAQELNTVHKNSEMDSFAFLQAEEKRSFIVEGYGGLERIVKTPIPYAMAVKSRRFIALFLCALPFALVNVSIVINPIICGLVAYALLSLDQIGYELQNPFSKKRLSHLPLDEICLGIENNLKELMNDNKHN